MKLDYVNPTRYWVPVECRKLTKREKRLIQSIDWLDTLYVIVTLKGLPSRCLKVFPVQEEEPELDKNKLYAVTSYNVASQESMLTLSTKWVPIRYDVESLHRISARYNKAREDYFKKNPPKTIFETLIPY